MNKKGITQFVVIGSFDRVSLTDMSIIKRSYLVKDKLLDLHKIYILHSTLIYDIAFRVPIKSSEQRYDELVSVSSMEYKMKMLYPELPTIDTDPDMLNKTTRPLSTRLNELTKFSEDTMFVFSGKEDHLIRLFFTEFCEENDIMYRFSLGTEEDIQKMKERKSAAHKMIQDRKQV